MTRSYKLVEEYEYTAHSSLVHSLEIPVAKFHFEPSPMQVLSWAYRSFMLIAYIIIYCRFTFISLCFPKQVLITENSKSFSHFITNVCAIIGGVFTVGVHNISFYSSLLHAPPLPLLYSSPSLRFVNAKLVCRLLVSWTLFYTTRLG